MKKRVGSWLLTLAMVLTLLSAGVAPVWADGPYTVTFDPNSNDATGTMDSQTTAADGTVQLNENGFTRVGYRFTGWNSDADGTDMAYSDQATIKLEQNITLYAQWEQVFTVTFKGNKADGGYMAPLVVAKGEETTLPKNVFTYTGYTFVGWNTKSDGSDRKTYADEEAITVNGDIELYAQWKKSFTVTFMDGDTELSHQNVVEKGKAEKPEDPTKDDLIFGGWYESSDLTGDAWDFERNTVTQNVTLYAKWNQHVYTVIFETNGGSEVAKQTVNKGDTIAEPDAPIRQGYAFGGWYKETALTNAWNFTEDTVTADITLYAKWDSVHTVRFYSNEGSGTMGAQKFEPGKEGALTANAFTRTNYSFKCWNTKADGSGTDYADKQSITPTSDLDLYAIWSPCVTFHANDGTEKKFVQTLASSGTTVLTANPYTRKGYSFKCWNTAADGSGTDYADKRGVTPNGDLDLYAVWTPHSYKVRFDGNGGSGTMPDQTFTFGTAQALSANKFTRTGRTFQGWTRIAGGKVEFTDKQSVQDLTDENGKTITLYAVWKLEVGDAEVRIQQGSKVLERMTSKSGDPYTFSVPVGAYNVVIESKDKTVTTLVVAGDEPVKGAAAFPPEIASSILELKPGTPDIVVGNLDVAANDNRVQGAAVELRLTIESKAANANDAEQTAIRKASPADKALDFFDLTLTKTVNGEEDETFRPETGDNLILMIPFKKAATKDLTVYRMHNGSVQTLTANTQQDEYIEAGDNMVTIHAKRFSTYAICYTPLDPEITYDNCPRNHTCPITPFDDSNPMSWYHDGVHWALDKGAMQGVSARRFFPNATTDRAQFVTILWRLAGSPRVSGYISFEDVPDDAWYTDAVRWAVINGIASGYSLREFGPDGTLTREQLATILYRYVRLKNASAFNIETTGLGGFRDASEVSDWARSAMDWMATYGIFDGTTNSAGERFLMPQDSATRAQTATVMMRCWNEFIG